MSVIAVLQLVLSQIPGFAPGLMLLWIAFRQGGKTSAAVGEFQQAVRLDPGYAEAQTNLKLALDQANSQREKQTIPRP